MTSKIRRLLGRALPPKRRPELPLAGWTEGRIAAPLVAALTDAELEELNAILPWNCFVVDGRGRRFGAAAAVGKRDQPQPVPDPRIAALDARFGLRGRSVLEIGCFEGVHTSALCALAREVVAVDARVENVVKTIVRTAFLGHRPRVFVCNVEDPAASAHLPESDFVHHVGVLYHLVDPVAHLGRIARLTRRALMLDTHVARPEQATEPFESGGRTFRVRRFRESGHADVFSGVYAHSNWLLLEDLRDVLRAAGFPEVEVVEERAEQNGARVLIHASRPESASAH